MSKGAVCIWKRSREPILFHVVDQLLVERNGVAKLLFEFLSFGFFLFFFLEGRRPNSITEPSGL